VDLKNFCGGGCSDQLARFPFAGVIHIGDVFTLGAEWAIRPPFDLRKT